MHVELDHLIIGGPRLEAVVAWVESVLGVEASGGGSHPGVGTHNALAGLAPDAYLELIAPDPHQPEPALPRWFGVDELKEPRLLTWSARTTDLEGARETAASAGLDLGAVGGGGRVRPDGVRLEWRVTDPRACRFDGVLPFLMDWGDSEHPAAGLEPRCTLVALRGYHPRVDLLRPAVDALGLPIQLAQGPTPRLEAELQTPLGLVTLR